jgi:hypothetical protein
MKNMVNYKKDLFDLMLISINDLANEENEKPYRIFGKWFSQLYYPNFRECFISDGRGDGKVDFIPEFKKGKKIIHAVINSKYTETYDKLAPPEFYSEAMDFYNFFHNKKNRSQAIERVREGLRKKYLSLFDEYDEGDLELIFITTCKRNEKYHRASQKSNLRYIHLDDLIEYYSEFIEGQKPVRIDPLVLSGISTVLSADQNESIVPTSIVFARIIDFVNYMKKDPLELLFARNVRLYLGNTASNSAIKNTYQDTPKEFVFSNNGITLLCSAHNHNTGQRELIIENPRVVNGSQTLHSIGTSTKHDEQARVMVRIIQTPQISNDINDNIQKRKDIIHKISIRTNMQNPIKRWDLVANDDFQNSIAEFFLKRRLFYERRQKEWKTRKEYFKEIKIKYGINIKELMQLMACYYYESKYHGPAIAQGNLGYLFDEAAYTKICTIAPFLAFQLYSLFEIKSSITNDFFKRKRKTVPAYYKFILFTLFLKDLKELKVLGKESLSSKIDEKIFDEIKLKEYFTSLVNFININFESESKKYKKENQIDLSYATFSKNPGMINNVINSYKNKSNARLLNILTE